MRASIQKPVKQNRKMRSWVKGAKAENRLLKVKLKRSAATNGGISTLERQSASEHSTVAKVQYAGAGKVKYHLRSQKNI